MSLRTQSCWDQGANERAERYSMPSSINLTRHNPGTSGKCFSGAPDTIRTYDLCLSGLAPTPPKPPKDIAEAMPIG
jgi:hypothetical protein